ADRALATAIVDALRNAAIGLRGAVDMVPLERLRQAREMQWDALETVARAELAGRGDDPTALIDELAASLRLRIQSWATLLVAAHVAVARGARLSPATAQGTTMTAAEALAGTVLGFVVGGLAMVAIGSDREVLWLALPLAAFVSASAPTAFHFAAGQAGFTILVIVLFNLIQPAGWRVG